jgi:hypothetical protein
LYASDFDYSKQLQSVFEIPRTQSASIGLDYTLVEDNQIGRSQTRNNFSESKVSFDFSCLLNNFNYFDKFGLSEIGELGAHYFFENFSGINNQQNFYILAVDENEDVIQDKIFSSNGECYTTAITECVFDSLDIDINVSELVKTSFSLNGLNIGLSLGNSGNVFTLSNGDNIECSLPRGSGILDAEMAFIANNIILDLSDNEYANRDINTCHVQKIQASFTLDRSETREVGAKSTKERNIKYPIKCKLDITAIPKDKSEFDALSLFDAFKTNDLKMHLYNESNEKIMSLNFDNLYLLSSKNSISIDNNPESVDLSFYCNLGAPTFNANEGENSRFYINYDKIVSYENYASTHTPESQLTGYFYSLNSLTRLFIQPERNELYDSSIDERTLNIIGDYLSISPNDYFGSPYYKLTCVPPTNGSSFYTSLYTNSDLNLCFGSQNFCIDFIMKINGNFRSDEWAPSSYYGCNIIRSVYAGGTQTPQKGNWEVQLLTSSEGMPLGFGFKWYTTDWKSIYINNPLYLFSGIPLHIAITRRNNYLYLYLNGVLMKTGEISDILVNGGNLQMLGANVDLYSLRIVIGDNVYAGTSSTFVNALPFKTY